MQMCKSNVHLPYMGNRHFVQQHCLCFQADAW